MRAGREAAGLHIAALAAALKVPVRKLEALEAGRYDELPDMTFARALASSACRHLKLDPAPVLEQLPHNVVPELGGSGRAINAPFKPATDPAPINPLSWFSRPALLVAIVLLLGALVIVFLPRAQESVGVADAPAVRVEPVALPQPGATVEPDASAGVAGAEAPAVPIAPEPVAPTLATPGSAGVPALSAPSVAADTAAAAGSLLTITATGDSWVEVTNGAGSVVTQRVLKSGDSIDFSTSPPYSVVLGRADAAQVMVRGQPFDANAIARNNVARFEVK